MGGLKFDAFPPDMLVCVVHYLTVYLKRTECLGGKGTRLFVYTKAPHGTIAGDTLRRWIEICLEKAGVETTLFTPHSVWAAAMRKAASTAVPLKTILKIAGWRSSAFTTFYNKPIIKHGAFGQAMLEKGASFKILQDCSSHCSKVKSPM